MRSNHRYYTDSKERFELSERIKAQMFGEKDFKPEKKTIQRRTTMLFNWHVRVSHYNDGTEYYFAEGNVIDHPWCVNSERVVTKPLRNYKIVEEEDEVLLYTAETEYHCPVNECTFYNKKATISFIPEMKKYIDKRKKPVPDTPSMDEDSILLVLSDHYGYFFEGLYVRYKGKLYRRDDPSEHIGTFGVSCPVSIYGLPDRNGEKAVSLYYYPHLYYLDFYVWSDQGLPVWIENRGEYAIHCKTPIGLIEICRGDRKLVSSENVINEECIPYFLSSGPLYWLSGVAD